MPPKSARSSPSQARKRDAATPPADMSCNDTSSFCKPSPMRRSARAAQAARASACLKRRPKAQPSSAGARSPARARRSKAKPFRSSVRSTPARRALSIPSLIMCDREWFAGCRRAGTRRTGVYRCSIGVASGMIAAEFRGIIIGMFPACQQSSTSTERRDEPAKALRRAEFERHPARTRIGEPIARKRTAPHAHPPPYVWCTDRPSALTRSSTAAPSR